jgi:mannose-6-phosphate isomerase-like protein (cupin superfamily)
LERRRLSAREIIMAEPTSPIRTFKYSMPQGDKAKQILWLAKTDRLFATVQVIRKGGETNLHSHSHLDGFWYILSGRARFYSDATTLIGEFGKSEGISIPRGTKYWFEAAGDEPLELLQVECSDIAMKTQDELMSDRNDFAPRKMNAAFVPET